MFIIFPLLIYLTIFGQTVWYFCLFHFENVWVWWTLLSLCVSDWGLLMWRLLKPVYIWVSYPYMGLCVWLYVMCVCVCVWLRVHCIFSGCVPLTLSVWSVCSLMEVARAKCRAPSCCLRHPRWHALCPSPCPTLKSSARPLTADSPHPHLRVSHPQLPLPSTNPITAPVSPQTTHRGQSEPIVSSSR